MSKISIKIVILLMGALVFMTAGCVQVAHKVDVLYSPLATFRGGTGPLELVIVETVRSGDTEPAPRWVIGKIKTTDGDVTGEVISSLHPQDVMADAFNLELLAAGYQISFSKALDNTTKKGIVFTEVSVQLDEIPLFAMLESSCSILLKMDVWKNGVVVKRTEYRSKVSDVAVIDREQLPRNLYQKAIHDTIQQAVPDILQQLN